MTKTVYWEASQLGKYIKKHQWRYYMFFGEALERLKGNGKIYRDGWNCKTLHLALVIDTRLCNGQYIGLYKEDILIAPWTASQTDLLAEDWRVKQPNHVEE